MTLDEAIKHSEEVAEEKFNNAINIRNKMKSETALENARECEKCAEKHKQFAEWLRDYKKLRQKDALIKDAISRYEMQALAQDEISSFEYEILKIYGVME